MYPVHVLQFETPKGVLLNGLWFGSKNAETVYVWVHGLSSTVFSKHAIAQLLARNGAAVLMFNNRGHDQVAKIYTSKGARLSGGSSHEKFTDSVDDIDGAIAFVKQNGGKRIFLVGHSTGCQKSAYWARKRGKGIEGIILLAPISDYAATVMLDGRDKIARAMRYAKALIKKGRRHELLPERIWSPSLLADAQRFVSLYSGSGPEEIFTYWEPKRRTSPLSKVKLPILVVLAEKDQYADRPAKNLYEWFLEHIYEGEVQIVPGADHGFKGEEHGVAKLIRSWSANAS